MVTTASFRYADHKKYGICNYVMILATIGFCIAQLAAEWIRFDGGTVSLWQMCTDNLNKTDCNGNPQRECESTSTEGPAWLEACRTLACFSLVFYVFIHIVFQRWNGGNTGSLLGQMKARAPMICYFLSGLSMLTNAVVYHVHYYDHYSKEENLNKVQAQFAFFATYVGGGISVVNCIFLSSKIDTGFMAVIKSKFACLQSNRNDRRCNAEAQQQGTEVRSRFAGFASALKRCGRAVHRKPCGENTAATPATNNNTRITSQRRITSNGLYDGPGSNLPRVFVIDNGEGNLALPNPERSRSVASVSRLEVEVRSISGVGESNDNDQTSPSLSNPPPPYSPSRPITDNSQIGHTTAGITTERQDRQDSPPPSYEEVMRSISNC